MTHHARARRLTDDESRPDRYREYGPAIGDEETNEHFRKEPGIPDGASFWAGLYVVGVLFAVCVGAVVLFAWLWS